MFQSILNCNLKYWLFPLWNLNETVINYIYNRYNLLFIFIRVFLWRNRNFFFKTLSLSRTSHSIRNASKGLNPVETRCNKCLSSVCGVLRISTESFHDIEGLHRIPLIPASTMNRPYASISHRRRTGAHARRISRFNSRRNDPGREEKRKGDGGWAKRGRRGGKGETVVA